MSLDEVVKLAENKYLSGDLQGAYDDARYVLSRSRTNGRAHYLLSCIAAFKGAHEDSLKLCKIAIQIDGAAAEYLAQLALCHMNLGQRLEAHKCAVQALSSEEISPIALDKLSHVFHGVADFSRALDVLKQLAVKDPNNSGVLANLGAVYFLCGQVGAAQEVLEKAIALDPKNIRAFGSLCGLKNARADDNYIDAIQALIKEESGTLNLIKLHYALAKQYEDIGNIEEAFASLKKGKDIFVSATGYRIEQDINMFAAISRYIDAAPPAPHDASRSQPLFVVGMPRSGTTVVERILTNCTGVVSIGESIQFLELVKQHCHGGSSRFVEASDVEMYWWSLPLEEIGKSYAAFGEAMSSGAERFVDKLPLNLLFVPLIVRALPNARIVCSIRNPLDTVLGNYRQLLETRTGSFGYTSSLRSTAVFVAEGARLARKMAQCYSKQFYLLSYEELVANPQAKAREFTRFCGIEWNSELLKIENNNAPAGSASAAQVRSPIHSKFVGRWRRYRAYLGEAVGVFEEYGIPWDW